MASKLSRNKVNLVAWGLLVILACSIYASQARADESAPELPVIYAEMLAVDRDAETPAESASSARAATATATRAVVLDDVRGDLDLRLALRHKTLAAGRIEAERG